MNKENKKPVMLETSTHKRLSLVKIGKGFKSFDNLINFFLDNYFKKMGEESLNENDN